MKRFVGLLVVSLGFAFPSVARVISYAPYTNKVAVPAFQERTTRHFALIESTASDYLNQNINEIVLYDSTGLEEPRVLAPRFDTFYDQVALFQKPGGDPLVLALGRPSSWSNRKVRLHNGGAEWKEVSGIGTFNSVQTPDVDTGGRSTYGPYAPIVLGTELWPFVVSLGNNGVWAIGADGSAKALVLGYNARAIGRDATGNRVLIQHGGAIWLYDVAHSQNENAVQIATVDPWATYAGWITSGGTVYLQILRQEGRFLGIVVDGTPQFVAGPYDTEPPDTGSPQYWQTAIRFFAVPTQDYEGAWIIQRQTGKPTTLLRHTPGGGLQTMWSDVSGPQVEALIPGASGQTVLVQVHREREGTDLTRPFLDPALAVWHVGQREPREYDELYLNESPNKGFVHVDVDAMESGAPFVFDSGFVVEEPSPSRVSAPIGGGGDVIQEWGVVRGSLRQRLVLPGVARLNGAFGSYWVTDLTLYNPVEAPQEVEVRFVPLGLDGSAATTATATITLTPLEIRAVPDALASLFGIVSGGGTLHFLPAVGMNVTARTYTRKGNGTFGFGMQAIDQYSAAGVRFPLTFAAAFPGENFRTNLLLTDTSGRGAQARLQATGPQGLAGEPHPGIAAPADGAVQLNGVGPAVGLLANAGGGLVVEPTRGTAIVTVAAIDNRTNDPTYFPPDLPATIVRTIPVIGHLDGANGAKFRSDLHLYNPTERYHTVTLSARSWSAPQWRNSSISFAPNESRVVKDVLKTLFGMEGAAQLRYSMPAWESGEGVRVTSRTYTVDASGGTYGCLVPPLNAFQIGTFGDRLEILGVSAGPGFRTNVGLVDLSDATQRESRVRISIIDDERRVVAAFEVRVPLRGGMQINDIFGSRGLVPPPAAMLLIDVLDGQQIGTYATLTDNVTNDSTYLSAQLGAQPQGTP